MTSHHLEEPEESEPADQATFTPTPSNASFVHFSNSLYFSSLSFTLCLVPQLNDAIAQALITYKVIPACPP